MKQKLIGILLGFSIVAGSQAAEVCPSATLGQNLDISMPSILYSPLVGDPMNLWADFSFYGSAPDGRMLWALNNYGVNIDNAASPYQDTIVFTVETGSQININGISSAVPYPVTIEGDVAKWEVPYADFIKELEAPHAPYINTKIVSGNLTILLSANKNGALTLSTKSNNRDDHLFIFLIAQGDDAKHSGALYDLARRTYWKMKEKTGILSGSILADDTAFSNSPISQNNYFSEEITFVHSVLLNHQMDFSWLTEAQRVAETANNEKWSPIANNPDQNANLARSFDVINKTASSSAFLIQAHTDNRMHSETRLSLNNIADYKYTYDSHTLECNASQGWCEARNISCCALKMINKGGVPTRATMNAYTTWSTVAPAVSIAVFGDITTTNHAESPSPGDDGNPAPLRYVLPSSR